MQCKLSAKGKTRDRHAEKLNRLNNMIQSEKNAIKRKQLQSEFDKESNRVIKKRVKNAYDAGKLL